LGLADSPGLTDYLTGNADPRDILQQVAGIRAISDSGDRIVNKSAKEVREGRLVCITAGTSAPQPAELLASERFREFLATVSETYDSVILDSAPLLTVADTLEIVPHVSGVLVCIRLRHTTRDQVRASQAALDRLPVRSVGVVLSGVQDAGEGYYGYYGNYGTPAGAAR
jgi:Mrp family chromosome partitioning ATPase